MISNSLPTLPCTLLPVPFIHSESRIPHSWYLAVLYFNLHSEIRNLIIFPAPYTLALLELTNPGFSDKKCLIDKEVPIISRQGGRNG